MHDRGDERQLRAKKKWRRKCRTEVIEVWVEVGTGEAHGSSGVVLSLVGFSACNSFQWLIGISSHASYSEAQDEEGKAGTREASSQA